MVSMYDATSDAQHNPYFPETHFQGFKEKKWKFVCSTLNRGRKYDIILLSHIHLLTVGWIIKKMNPSVKVVLLTHGIEVWNRLSSIKRMMLNHCDQIWSVSEFTRSKLIGVNQVHPEKVKVFNNCLDPFLPHPVTGNSGEFREKYLIPESAKVMLTLTRLSVTERKKGYLDVISAMNLLSSELPQLYYVIAGGYNEDEKKVIISHARECKVAERVIIAGFIPDEALPNLFGSSDLYIMPSDKEGFGIVFIEALYYGLPVIGGNADGSADALKNGKWGAMVCPGNLGEIANAIREAFIIKKYTTMPAQVVLNEFGYGQYQQKLHRLIEGIS